MKNKIYKEILKKIKQYQHIVIFRHEIPDFDASGSQFGLKTWINDNFPEKKVYAVGCDHKFFSETLFMPTDKITEIPQPFLAIVLDTANYKRMDGKELCEKADYVIRMDHHPRSEEFADFSVIDTKYSACAELVAEMLFSFKKYRVSKDSAYYLYAGLVGDNGRFQYSSTTITSFEIAAKLIKTGIDFTEIYEKMYIKSLDDIKILKYIYNHYQMSENGVIYYYFPATAQEELHIEKEQVKAYVNLFSTYKESRIWVSFTEDKEANMWNVSIRSRRVVINEVAAKFNGGGHANASGARLETIEETEKLIAALDQLLV